MESPSFSAQPRRKASRPESCLVPASPPTHFALYGSELHTSLRVTNKNHVIASTSVNTIASCQKSPCHGPCSSIDSVNIQGSSLKSFPHLPPFSFIHIFVHILSLQLSLSLSLPLSHTHSHKQNKTHTQLN